MGVSSPLVDNEGFPLSGVDIIAARKARNLLAMLTNDRHALDKRIYELVQDALSRQGHGAASTPTAAAPTETQASTPSVCEPAPRIRRALYVRHVAPESPAARAVRVH